MHIDHGAAVLKWAEGISEKVLATLVCRSRTKEFKNDILIVAGDLGDTFNAIKSVPEGFFSGQRHLPMSLQGWISAANSALKVLVGLMADAVAFLELRRVL